MRTCSVDIYHLIIKSVRRARRIKCTLVEDSKVSEYWFHIDFSTKYSDDYINFSLYSLLPRYLGQKFEIKCWYYSVLLSFPSPPIKILSQVCIKYWTRERGSDILKLSNTAKYNYNSHVEGYFLNVHILLYFLSFYPPLLLPDFLVILLTSISFNVIHPIL